MLQVQQQPRTEQFSKCNFVNTEINHDLNPPVSTRENTHDEDFLRISRSYLDQNGVVGCNNFLDYFEFFNDSAIVEKITGYTLPDIKNIEPNQDIIFNPLVKKVDNNRINSERIQANIKRYSKPYDSRLVNLFPNDQDDVFFIIDTGDNFVQILKGLTINRETPLKINVIHSVVTLGDSAPKTLPDSKNYHSENRTVFLYSWYYSIPIEISANDDLFMSSFRINSNLSGLGWKIRQDWYLDQALLYQTLDAKKENSKPLVKTYLSKNLTGAVNSLRNTQANITEETQEKIKTNSLNMQKKRSGDYLQIWIAKKFPEIIVDNNDNGGNLIFVKGPSPTNTQFPNVELASIDEKKEWYKKRTYFITGDWPAFSYAIYNKINAIIIFKHPTDPLQSCIIRVFF